MVSEVYLYWIIYETCSSPVDLPKTQAALRTWKEEWKYLFGKRPWSKPDNALFSYHRRPASVSVCPDGILLRPAVSL